MKTIILDAPQTELTITSVRASQFRETASKLQAMAIELNRMGNENTRIQRLERAMKLLLRSTAEAMVEQADQEDAELQRNIR